METGKRGTLKAISDLGLGLTEILHMGMYARRGLSKLASPLLMIEFVPIPK